MEDFRDNIVAVDCEMVGVGRYGRESVLARACVVSGRQQVLIDEYCSSEKTVTNYRTRISGIEEKHMKNAQALSALQKKVKNAIAGKIVVGHGLKNDFQVLAIDHPESMKRDTAEYFLGKFTRNKRPGLKQLARDQLGRIIQNGAHSPAIDAKAALDIYLKNRDEWEATLALGSLSISRPARTPTKYHDYDHVDPDNEVLSTDDEVFFTDDESLASDNEDLDTDDKVLFSDEVFFTDDEVLDSDDDIVDSDNENIDTDDEVLDSHPPFFDDLEDETRFEENREKRKNRVVEYSDDFAYNYSSLNEDQFIFDFFNDDLDNDEIGEFFM